MYHPQKVRWIIDQHVSTNHMYDHYLPYEFHLRMAYYEFRRFQHLLPPSSLPSIELAVWGHDLLEDTRVSYNDVKSQLGHVTTEIIYAVTNEKGRTRKDRANNRYYKGIRKTEGAVFVKLCDRIANVKYSNMTGSTMKRKYADENDHFLRELGRRYEHSLAEMFMHLCEQF